MASQTKLNAPAALVNLPLAVRPLLQREEL